MKLISSENYIPQLTFDRLVNKQYIKLCGDGTFRMMREQCIVVTLGVLSKRYGISKVDSLSAFRTTFSGCFFAISNKESAPAYKFVFESACKVVQQLCDIQLAEVVRQYHAGTLGKKLHAERSLPIPFGVEIGHTSWVRALYEQRRQCQ